ncbi:MAG: C39 family peptidase, partial [Lachnospiraceae bacterium]|nr:C39 family peptidase [Lachnospiraceae bacterium]
SCGYAVIEMFGAWSGHDVPEDKLYSEYGRVVTSTGKSFAAEMNKQFPEYETSMHKYMKNSELIDAVYESLENGMPVPIEWAALYGDVWTLHYSLITGMDIPNDKVYIANPYGYNEEISIEEFLLRTSYEAYENMPWFLKMGFAFGIFEKNTIF